MRLKRKDKLVAGDRILPCCAAARCDDPNPAGGVLLHRLVAEQLGLNVSWWSDSLQGKLTLCDTHLKALMDEQPREEPEPPPTSTKPDLLARMRKAYHGQDR